MRFIDVENPNRLNGSIINKVEIFSGNFLEKGFIIKKVELRLYKEKVDSHKPPYHLITSYVETDKGSIEMVYEEGQNKKDSLEKTASFLKNQLGISSLILRSIISLAELKRKNKIIDDKNLST